MCNIYHITVKKRYICSGHRQFAKPLKFCVFSIYFCFSTTFGCVTDFFLNKWYQSCVVLIVRKLIKMAAMKFETEHFDGKNNFNVWQSNM